jgi:hypothetical protein
VENLTPEIKVGSVERKDSQALQPFPRLNQGSASRKKVDIL